MNERTDRRKAGLKRKLGPVLVTLMIAVIASITLTLGASAALASDSFVKPEGKLIVSRVNSSTANGENQTPTLTDRVDVRVVNVEVAVTDRQGLRIRDLAPDDFELFVDGQQTPIEFFSEIQSGQTVRTADGPDTISGDQARGTSYLVFVDDFFSIAPDRNRILRGLGEDLAVLGPKDRMAIVSWNGRTLDMLSTWTNDERDLKGALRQAIDRPALGLHRIAERNLIDGSGYRGTRFLGGRSLDITERSYAVQLTQQLESTVEAATATLRSFAFPPGRKVMLLASGGWAYNPAEFVSGARFASTLDYQYLQGDRLYQPLVDTANLLGYTLYPLDTPGLQATAGVDVAYNRGSYYGRPLDSFGPSQLDGYREDELEYTLKTLAAKTGGKAMINGKASRALMAVYDDTRSFYWLGFTSDRLGDGVTRDIQVRLRNRERGTKVRTRANYTDLSRNVELASAVESVLLFRSVVGEGLQVSLGRPSKAGFGKMTQPVVVSLPLDQIAMLPSGQNEVAAELELRFGVIDKKGARSDIPVEVIRLTRKELVQSGGLVEYETQLLMRRRQHDLAVALYDPNTAQLWASTTLVGKPLF